MSDETEEVGFEGFEFDSSLPESPDATASMSKGDGEAGFEELRKDLFAAIEELGLAPGGAEDAGSGVPGCYLSAVPSDRQGEPGIVVRWLLQDQAVPDAATPLPPIESVDILNEALGPLLLALGFPIEPYAAGGGWIVTGPRTGT